MLNGDECQSEKEGREAQAVGYREADFKWETIENRQSIQERAWQLQSPCDRSVPV